MENPLLSIIIPTKNRYNYLKYLIELLVSFNDDSLEIIIQDNSSDNNNFINWISPLLSDKCKYFHNSSWLSVCDNIDVAVNNSQGEYVCCIGDDDGVVADIVEFTRWMKEQHIESAITNVPQYYWPDITHKIHSFSGTLRYKKYNKRIKHLDIPLELTKCLKKGGTSLEKMPRVYHGIVSRQALNKIYELCDTYFPGPSPDMASSVALSTIIKSHIFYDYPLIISGAGFKSTGGAGARKQHVGDLNKISHLPKNTAINWDSRVPKVWTGQTIWAESAIKSLEKMNNDELINVFNFNYLYASFFIFHFDLRNYIFDYKLKLINYVHISFNLFKIYKIRLYSLYHNIFAGNKLLSSFKIVKGINNINACIKELTRK